MVKKTKFKKIINENSEIFRLLVIMVVVFFVILFVIPNKSTMLSMSMLSSMMTQMPEIGIFATAVTFAMLLGVLIYRLSVLVIFAELFHRYWF